MSGIKKRIECESTETNLYELRCKVFGALAELLEHDELPPALANSIYQSCGMELVSFNSKNVVAGGKND